MIEKIKELIKNFTDEQLNTYEKSAQKECDKFEDVVKIAKQNAKLGDYVVLAPGCASFDFFNSYKERGKMFKKLIEEV